MGRGRDAAEDAGLAGARLPGAPRRSAPAREPASDEDADLDEGRALRAAAEARVGGRLGPFHVLDILGIGGTAAVYRAAGAGGEPVALKVLHAALARDPRARRRFLREAEIARWLDHPRVVRILETGEGPGGAPYHVMELHEGTTLEQRRASAPDGLPCDAVVRWIDDLLWVLSAAHEKGIVHRDIKPANLLLDREGRIHLLDFGIVRTGPDQRTTSLATRSGALLGTVSFMPPEQALGMSDEIDARTDVWAVGATMFTLITGQLVHRARSVNEAVVLAATQSAPPIRQIDARVPKPLAAVVDRALHFDKAERFADAAAMRKALRRACSLDEGAEARADAAAGGEDTVPEESLPEGLSRAQIVFTSTRNARGRRLRAAGAALVAVVGVAGLVWTFSRGEGGGAATAPAVTASGATTTEGRGATATEKAGSAAATAPEILTSPTAAPTAAPAAPATGASARPATRRTGAPAAGPRAAGKAPPSAGQASSVTLPPF